MSTVEVVYSVTNQVVRDEMIKTGNARPDRRSLSIDLTQIDEQLRRVLVEAIDAKGAKPVVFLCERFISNTFLLDHDPTPDEIPALLNELKQHSAKREEEQKAKNAEEHKAREAFLAERQKMNELAEQTRARVEEAKKQAEIEKNEWIVTFGSAHLKRAHVAGYDSQRQYVIERTAKELPGFVVDFNDTSRWSSRSFPSEQALDTEESARKAGFKAKVVWLTAPATSEIGTTTDDYDNLYDFEECEAVVVQQYLDKYDAVKIIV